MTIHGGGAARLAPLKLVTMFAVATSACGSPSATPHTGSVNVSRTEGTMPSASTDARSVSLQGLLDDLITTSDSGALALVVSPERTWQGAAGMAGDHRPVDPRERFAIASTTKTFVAAVVLQLVGEGTLSLDDSVGRVLPGEVRDGDLVKVRHLLDHTSGIAEGPLPMVEPLLTEPGTVHRYSNTNYVILGRIVTEVTGEPVEVAVRDRIFRPLNLTDTSYGSAASRQQDDDLHRHRRAGRLPPWLGGPLSVTVEPETGAGGIVSTADDLATFFRALMRGDLIGEAEMTEMLRTVSTETDPLAGKAGGDPRAGLGIFGFTLACGSPWGHGGDMPGYSNQVLASRDGSTIVVVAQNTSGWPLANEVAEAMFCL